MKLKACNLLLLLLLLLVIVIIVKEVGRFRSKRERERLQAVDDVVVNRLRGTELRLCDELLSAERTFETLWPQRSLR